MQTRRRLLDRLLTLAVFGAWPGAAARGAEPGAPGLVLETVAGTVEVRSAGASAWRPATAGARLAAGDAVRTGDRSKAKVVHAGGAVWLFDRTVLHLPGAGMARGVLRRPVLASGQALFEVDGRRMRDLLPGAPFEVQTPSIVAGVKGTVFLVVERDGMACVGVLDGVVETAPRAAGAARPAQVVRDRGIDYHHGRLSGWHELRTPAAWEHMVRHEASDYTYQEMVRGGWLR
jgi:ferric-dicitrate binding protein FerR (iron transport regulator)